MRSALMWPAVIIASALALESLVAEGIESPVRVLLTFWFALFCVGMAWVPLLRLESGMTQAVVALALSAGISIAVSEVLVLIDAWSAERALRILTIIAGTGVALQVAALVQRWRRSPAPRRSIRAARGRR